MNSSRDELETYCKGLADATRLRILNLLTDGELCGCDIERVLGTRQPNVSRHLIYLKHSGLVLDRRDGFRVFYRLAPAQSETLASLFRFLAAAFRREEGFRSDLRHLEEAIKDGACRVPPRRARGRAGRRMRAGSPQPRRKAPNGPRAELPRVGPWS
jgi:ArsR family transcriptional regulator, arsenate/arsenite/antimonite-responsive transcriptional repressor